MRSCLVRLISAIFMFAVGLCVVEISSVRFQVDHENRPPLISTHDSGFSKEYKNFYEIEMISRDASLDFHKIEPKKTMEFSCRDRIFESVWRYWKQHPGVRNAAQENFNDCSELIAVNKFLDLNSDGINEVVVQGIHPFVNGSRGNSRFYISQKVGNSYRIIAEAHAQEFKLAKSSNGDYADIVFKYMIDVTSDEYSTFSFSRSKYVERKCVAISYATNGKKWVSRCVKSS